MSTDLLSSFFSCRPSLSAPPNPLPHQRTQHLQNSDVYNNYYCPRASLIPSPSPLTLSAPRQPAAPLSTVAMAWSPLQPPWTGWSMVHAYPASPAWGNVRSPLLSFPRVPSLATPAPILRALSRTRTRVLRAPSTRKEPAERVMKKERREERRERGKTANETPCRYGEY